MSIKGRPNILIVMSDQQRGDTLGPTHSALMPHWQEFSRRAVWFREAFCPTAHCCPSRASFFTGLHPSQHGVWNNVGNRQRLSSGLNPGVRLWSESLAEEGYNCYFSGKWHVSATENPADRGWREGRVSAKAGTQMGREWSDYIREEFVAVAERPCGSLGQVGYSPSGHKVLFGADANAEIVRHDEGVTEDVSAFLRDAASSSQPWCVFAGLLGPHDPYAVPPEWLDRVPPELVSLPGNYPDDLTNRPDAYRRLRSQVFDQMPPEEAREAIRHYYAFCAFVDHQFGCLMAALAESGQQDNTVVILCSDHGDYAGEHGLFCKGLPAFRGAYHVPLAIAGPGVAGGRTVDAITGLTDVGPTILELTGAGPLPTSGHSLVPWLRNEVPQKWRTAWCSQMEGTEIRFSQRSIRSKEWLYVYNPAAVDELYDLRSDPGETVNLADLPEYRGVMQERCAQMWQELSELDDGLVNDYYTVALAPVGPGLAKPEPCS